VLNVGGTTTSRRTILNIGDASVFNRLECSSLAIGHSPQLTAAHAAQTMNDAVVSTHTDGTRYCELFIPCCIDTTNRTSARGRHNPSVTYNSNEDIGKAE